MIVAAVIGWLLLAQGPMELQPFAGTDPALAQRAWDVLEAQDAATFGGMIASDAELVIDGELVDPAVESFAAVVAACDAASPFVWVSNVLGPTAPFEAELTCEGPQGHRKKAAFFFDGNDRIVAIDVAEPIVFKP